MKSFNDSGLNQEILKALAEMGFETPTPIQAKAIPHLMSSNQDIIASAQTGTGKTAAFGLPIINNINTKKKNTQSIILCPTRELCLQITKDLKLYSKYIKALQIKIFTSKIVFNLFSRWVIKFTLDSNLKIFKNLVRTDGEKKLINKLTRKHRIFVTNYQRKEIYYEDQ